MRLPMKFDERDGNCSTNPLEAGPSLFERNIDLYRKLNIIQPQNKLNVRISRELAHYDKADRSS